MEYIVQQIKLRRVVEPWNNLPQEVACAASVDDFKKLIDQYSSNTMYKCM